jgi:hypothetical protein
VSAVQTDSNPLRHCVCSSDACSSTTRRSTYLVTPPSLGRPIEERHARRRQGAARATAWPRARRCWADRSSTGCVRGRRCDGLWSPRRPRVRGGSSLPGRGRLSGPRWAEHPRQHPSPVRAEDVEWGGQKAGSRHRVPKLALQPGPRDAKAHELRQHLDEIRAANELDLVRSRTAAATRAARLSRSGGAAAGLRRCVRAASRLHGAVVDARTRHRCWPARTDQRRAGTRRTATAPGHTRSRVCRRGARRSDTGAQCGAPCHRRSRR